MKDLSITITIGKITRSIFYKTECTDEFAVMIADRFIKSMETTFEQTKPEGYNEEQSNINPRTNEPS